MCAAGATTTVYPSTNAEDTVYILGDSESRVVFAEDDEQVAKLTAHRSELPHVTKVITFEGASDGDWVISLEDLAALGAERLAEQPDVVRTTSQAIRPDQLATLIYTSGTTGRPKGVRLRHASWVYEGEAISAQDILVPRRPRVPLAADGALLRQGAACRPSWPAASPRAIDGRVEKIVDNLGVVKPTFMGAAPRIFEKAHGRIVTMQAAEGGAKEKIFKQAFKVGLEVERLKREGKSVPAGSRCSTGSSTSWSSPRSATASVEASASSSPVPPRSTATSPSGSTPPAS